MDIIPITVIIPVKNEEKNLPFCLEQLNGFGQIIVIDSSSTDKTPQIAKKYGAEYYNFFWDGKFPKKRNWALKNVSIKYDWVFFLDADEYLNEKFKKELFSKLSDTSIDGYWVTYRNYFMGKQLRYGDTMKKLPIFRKNSGEYEKINEDSWSNLDMEVHEHPIVQGKTGAIKIAIEHNDYKGLEHYISRHNAYSSWEAKRYMLLLKNGFEGLTFRQKLKYRLIGTGILPIVYFIGSYIIKFGFLDGVQGYYLAKYKSGYFFQIQTKILEHKAMM